MRKLPAIMSALTGLALSMTLPGCGPPIDRPATPAAIAVEVRDRAPAELLACAERPEGFPADAAGQLPRPVRDALARIALAFGRNADRQDRLINWNAPGTCSAATGLTGAVRSAADPGASGPAAGESTDG